MATIFPSLSSIKRMTSGERRFGQRLEAMLEDDYLVWYDIPVGRKRRYPDFVILHPGRGLLFLEVKDWKIDTIVEMSPDRFVIDGCKGRSTVSNPLHQARQYAFTALNQLKLDPMLIQQGERYQGKLCFPYGFGVVFPNITNKQWQQINGSEALERILPTSRVIFRDDMAPSTDPEEFQQRLWAMFDYRFGGKLSVPQIDRIRWHLFPEVRVDVGTASLFAEHTEEEEENKPPAVIPDIVQVMDLQQEQLARSMGDGHRVIHGVAGSGKTMILGYRCLYLAQAVHLPVLVLCFNITLAARLRSFVNEKGIAEKVKVHHFHEWCRLQLKTYNVDTLPGAGQAFTRQVKSVIQGVEESLIPRAQYSAVLIDEGHDFEQAWLQLVVQMVDPDVNSVLLLYDDAQSIYRRSHLKFPLSAAGIQARGRTTILKLNYRNTREILTFAYDFARDFLEEVESDEDHIPLVKPELAGVTGPPPAFRRLSDDRRESAFIIRCIQKWQNDGDPLNSIAVIYPRHAHGRRLAKAIQSAGILCCCLDTPQGRCDYDPGADQVVLLTRQSSKGLEFDTVIVAGIDELSDKEETRSLETRLLYVGMTRARRRLLITSGGKGNWYADRLENLNTRQGCGADHTP